MSLKNLDQWVKEQENLVESFRKQGGYYEGHFPVVPNEQTNWIDEVRAIAETAALADLSHHMTSLRLTGPDVVRLLKRLCVNDFDNFEIGKAKQIVMCNHEGYHMGDGPLLRLGDEEFYAPGMHATKWIQYNIETGDYDVTAEIEPPTSLLPGDPEKHVLQLQGPNAYDILDELTDDDFRNIGFYRFEEIELAGYETIALGHGMSPEAGFEFIGSFENYDGLIEAIVEVGEDYGLKRLGSRTYVSNSVRVGWVPPHPRPVYDLDEMEGYRQWADGEKEEKYGKWGTSEEPLEATFSLEGSFESNDVRDYYLRSIELGYGKLVDLDHDFIGKAAIEAEIENPERELVSLIWDNEDVHRINNSLFGEGDNHKFMNNLPRIGWARQAYDEVLKDDESIGISHSRSFQWDIRQMTSLAVLDTEYTEPGTEVTVVWGEPGGESPNPTIEKHVQTDISATVQPPRYTGDKRGSN